MTAHRYDAPTMVDLDRARTVIGAVVDPEIPVLSISELGILRDVDIEEGRIIATLTPTYSGCPALRQIEDDVLRAAARAGFEVEVRVSNHPAWTTDWLGVEARRKLSDFGISPPAPTEGARCPRCMSTGARVVSNFGATACKALLTCASCGEPFELFKEH